MKNLKYINKINIVSNEMNEFKKILNRIIKLGKDWRTI